MPATLPALTETLDTAFTHTWYDIRREATDNVLNATPLWALLKSKGCFKKQVGGRYIERTIRYQLPTPTNVQKGDMLGEGETETETAALWTWRYIAIHVQRSIFDDQKNAGPSMIKPYVASRITAAKDALVQYFEQQLYNSHVTTETGKAVQGIFDLCPPTATRSTGTYGGIARPTAFASDIPTTGNTWWSPRYYTLTGAIDQTLVSDMNHLYNVIHNQQIPPDIILTDQATYELYTEYGLDAVQIVQNESYKKLLDLGFDVVMFRGKPLIWSSYAPANTVRMLTSSKIEVVYDPNMWMAMTEWKPIAKQGERLAHIVTALNIVTDEPRRHGILA